MSETTDAIITQVAHRPWPLPSGPWIMFQSWRDLLFAHWRVPAAMLRPLVPSSLAIEEFDGSAWVGQTPFTLTGLRARGLPAVPGLSEFPEMNLRTYVRVGDKPGIYFFTLEAASILAVIGARILYWLPYRHADMRVTAREEWIEYRSRRSLGRPAEFVGRYRAVGSTFEPAVGTLEHFLTERYALYAVLGHGIILRGEIHHPPWTLQSAEAVIDRNTVPAAHGITLPEGGPLLHFAARQDTLIWPPRSVS